MFTVIFSNSFALTPFNESQPEQRHICSVRLRVFPSVFFYNKLDRFSGLLCVCLFLSFFFFAMKFVRHILFFVSSSFFSLLSNESSIYYANDLQRFSRSRVQAIHKVFAHSDLFIYLFISCRTLSLLLRCTRAQAFRTRSLCVSFNLMHIDIDTVWKNQYPKSDK